MLRKAILRVEDKNGRLIWRRFCTPVDAFVANEVSAVPDVVAEVERAAFRGEVCVGFIAYEAAPAFDPALSVHPQLRGLPLAAFGAFDRWEDSTSLPESFCHATVPQANWRPDIPEPLYREAIRRLKAYIAAGDTYQVNFTFRLQSPDAIDPKRLFADIASCRRTVYAAYLDFGEFVVCSASPELFLALDGSHIVTKPMKGTAPRGRFTSEDVEFSNALKESEKDRAENLMIVDMARNDLGRIAQTGSVRVTSLFEVERYATVHQMTSTVEAATDASLEDILRATFPAASITGAPKKRTMEIIREMEAGPRGVYTGCIGTIGPGRHARLSVAIRTAVLDRGSERWEYGVGGGVVWDSTAEGEYDECRLKAAVLQPLDPPFELLETLRWTPEDGYWLLARHLRRLAASAEYFDFDYSETKVRRALREAAESFEGRPQRVRLTMDRGGEIKIAALVFEPWAADRPLRLALADSPIDHVDRFLYHKTTRRNIYDAAKPAHPDADEVLLWNRKGLVTEGSFSNVAVELDRRLLTPPVSCGLLPGTLRTEMIESGVLEEAEISLADLHRADAIYVLNSVRGMAQGTLIQAPLKV